MSDKQKAGGVPYRAKIETGGKGYNILNGPGEKKFLFNSAIFQETPHRVTFTLDKLGEVSCIITGINKSVIETIPADKYYFFGRTGSGLLIIGYYSLCKSRSGWMSFYTKDELRATNPLLAGILRTP